jgi:nicotinamidase-related amidase
LDLKDLDVSMTKNAIVLIEFQRQWTERGLYHWLIRGQLNKRQVVQNTRGLVARAREAGALIIHAPLIIDPANKKGLLAHLTFGKVFTKGTWKSEFTDGLFDESDVVIRNRTQFDAFPGSTLEEVLRDNGIEQIFFCGLTTDFCVAMTMRTALKRDFACTMVSDCTATLAGFIQAKIEREFSAMTMTSDEAFELLTGKH